MSNGTYEAPDPLLSVALLAMLLVLLLSMFRVAGHLEASNTLSFAGSYHSSDEVRVAAQR